jgi:myo-inositol-1(or 4)-monophosphatase
MSAATSHARATLDHARRRVVALLPTILAGRSDVRWKEDGSPVTASDVFLENELAGLLADHLPGVVVQGEETWDSTGPESAGAGWTAVIDPIDGTENFCSGLKEWGVSISLWHDGAHAASMLLLPELGEHLTTGDRPARLRSRIVGLSSTVSPETNAVLQTIREARITGCAVYNLFNVARGAFARFVNPRGAYSWDLLAGLQLATESGCRVELDGELYDGRFLAPGRRYRVDIQYRHDLHSG